jgi:2,3-bisphosphoglycerate-dependent phosphoglycerate mutase
MERTLVLVRHGQSEWNLKNLFTGWKDPGLTAQGVREAHEAGRKLKSAGFTFDAAFTSELSRAQRTLDIILGELGQSDLPVTRDKALNERDYGDLTGLNKDEAAQKWGEDQVRQWRRSFDIRPPGGESLEDTANRAVPYFERAILPEVKAGKNVIVSAHGNSLRALLMVLEGLDRDRIVARELATGAPLIYRMSPGGQVLEHSDLV